MAKKPSDVNIVVTVNHVYLPLDEHGNGRADWAAPMFRRPGSTSAPASRFRPTSRGSCPTATRRRSSDDPASAWLRSRVRPGAMVARGRRGQLGAEVVPAWWHRLLDLNREAQNHCDPYNGERDVRMVARIPLIVIAKWRNELGVDYWNPDHQDKVDALLNDADWRWLRTDGAALRHCWERALRAQDRDQDSATEAR